MLSLPQWQISVGYLSEQLRPVFFALSVAASTFVLADARRRGLKLYAYALWTLGTFLFPVVVAPLYFAARIFTQSRRAQVETPQTSATSAEATSRREDLASAETNENIARAVDFNDENSEPHKSHQPSFSSTRLRPLLAPALYALTLSAAAALYFYLDYRTADAHLARAANARLRGNRASAINELRAALHLEDDPHTRKLLGLELAADSQHQAALDEFVASDKGGEPDEMLSYRVGVTLEALERRAEAAISYRNFLGTKLCAQDLPDARCERARVRLRAVEEP